MKSILNIAKVPVKLTGMVLIVVGGALVYGPHGLLKNDNLFNERFWLGDGKS